MSQIIESEIEDIIIKIQRMNLNEIKNVRTIGKYKSMPRYRLPKRY